MPQNSPQDHDASDRAPIRKRRKLLLLLLSLAIGVLTAEAGLRVWASFNAGSLRPLISSAIPHTRVWRTDAVRNHARLEGVRFIATGDPPGIEYCTWAEISAQGLNDDVVPIQKPPGEFRILVLGNSFVEAIQVPRRQNFCKQLERLLSQKLSGSPPPFTHSPTLSPAVPRPSTIRVINAGISTYSPLLEYLYFTGDLASYQPDAVIQVFFSNDVYDDMRYTALAQFDSQGLPIAVGPGDHWIVFPRGHSKQETDQAQWAFRRSLSESAPWVAQQFYCASLIHHIAAGWHLKHSRAQPPINDEFFILEDDPALVGPQREGWKLTRKYIQLLKAASDKSGARFLLTSAPIASQVYGETSYDHFFFKGKPTDADQLQLKQIAAELSVPFVDMLTPLRKARTDLYFPRDGHWTAKAHRVVAENLAPAVWNLIQDKM